MIQHIGFDHILHYLGYLIVTVLFEHPFIVAALFIIFPSLLWKRAWFTTYSILFGLFFFGLWAVDAYQRSRPESIGHDSPGDAFGYALFMVLVIGYVLGFALRVAIYSGIKYFGKSKKQPNPSIKRDVLKHAPYVKR